MLIELVEHNLCINIMAKLYNYAHTVLIRLIAKSSDTVNLLVLDKFCDSLDKLSLIYKVWKLCYDDPVLAAVHRLYVCYGSADYLASSCSVCFLSTSCSKDYTACRVVRCLDDRQ